MFLTLSFAGAILLSSCSQNGVSPETNAISHNFNPNTVQTMRLSTLDEPMVWGGSFREPGVDSVIPGDSRKEKIDPQSQIQCLDTSYWYSYINYVPLYQDADVFLARIKSVQEEVELLNPGKLMVVGTWKFVTDVNRGIHIYNDTDPANPQKVAFIYVPGVLDIALKNKMLYANAYSALVTIDITNPLAAKAVDMIPAAFPDVYSWGGPVMDSLGNVAVAWRADTVYTCGYWRDDVMYEGSGSIGASSPSNMVDSNDGEKGPTLGQNASMSRFAISADWLYTVDYNSLRLFDITAEESPKVGPIVGTNTWDLETIFRYKDALFLGSMTGMLIYDHSKTGAPVLASTYSHITSCDPVVVQEDVAYVTLRSGNRCMNGKNELNVIDVADIYNPKVIGTMPMQNPAGLAVEDSTLFVCEGSYGLAVLDIQDPANPKEISRVSTVQPEDVIANEGILTLIGPSGIWRMDYTDRKNLELLSFTESEIPPEEIDSSGSTEPGFPGVITEDL